MPKLNPYLLLAACCMGLPGTAPAQDEAFLEKIDLFTHTDNLSRTMGEETPGKIATAARYRFASAPTKAKRGR